MTPQEALNTILLMVADHFAGESDPDWTADDVLHAIAVVAAEPTRN